MNALIEKLVNIRDAAMALPSLAPGDGYDVLGFELSSIVSKSVLTHAERQALFTAIHARDPRILPELRDISVKSEIELDKYQAVRILEKLSDSRVRQDIQALPQEKRLKEVLTTYPYDWCFACAIEEVRLLETLDASPDHTPLVYFLGRSTLPLSALSLYFFKGCRVIWGDPCADSAHLARQFITELENFRIIEPNSIEIHHTHCFDDAFFSRNAWAVIVQDDELMHPDVFQAAAARKLPLVTMDPIGMTGLLYPSSARKVPDSSIYTPHAVLLARHASDEPVGEGIKRLVAQEGIYLSLSLYRPT